MTPPLDELYFEWLYGQTGSLVDRNPNRTYWELLRALYSKEFVWIVPNDDNRIEDGRALREQFIEHHQISRPDRDWLDMPCSFLELLLGLSRRLSFEAGGEPRRWFWRLIENIELEYYTDGNHFPATEVDEILDRVIWRTYRRNGRGGLFPLKRARGDQRKVELWYQLCAYVLEIE